VRVATNGKGVGLTEQNRDIGALEAFRSVTGTDNLVQQAIGSILNLHLNTLDPWHRRFHVN
jgi:hypothetical protein